MSQSGGGAAIGESKTCATASQRAAATIIGNEALRKIVSPQPEPSPENPRAALECYGEVFEKLSTSSASCASDVVGWLRRRTGAGAVPGLRSISSAIAWARSTTSGGRPAILATA